MVLRLRTSPAALARVAGRVMVVLTSFAAVVLALPVHASAQSLPDRDPGTALGFYAQGVAALPASSSPPPAPPLTGQSGSFPDAEMTLPRAGATVGVGMPLRLAFAEPVRRADRQAVVDRIRVTVDGADVPGGWLWSSARLAHFRPDAYWPARSTVLVSAPDGSAYGSRSWEFSTGRDVVLRVDGARHHMKVMVDGVKVRSVPVSLGKAGWRTRNGVKVIMSKLQGYTMRGTDENGPYRITVEHAFRLTDTGEFVHSAPWSVAWQGRDNRSHGCTNVSPADARWLAQQVRVGTPVEFVRTGGSGMTLFNGWGEWNAAPGDLMRPSLPSGETVPGGGTASGGVPRAEGSGDARGW